MKCPKCNADNPDDSKFCKECGTNITSAEEAQPSITKTIETPVESFTRGTYFANRYEIIEELGRGGMGAVYRVEDTKTKEEIALKLIKPEIAADQKTIERFRNELTTARKIRHKNICGMYDLNEEKGTHYITMEYVPGEDLKSFLRRTGRLTVSKAISIGKQVFTGLVEAHGLGIVHRDLKPSNIMIDKKGNARIMDFGIARSIKGKGITGSGVMIGTPEYMSPEQVEADKVDQRSDIYSLGIIMYEMLTGRVPFEGDTALSIAMKHKGEIPKDPKEYNAQLPDDLSQLILKCMEKDKDSRYQSAGDLYSELDKIWGRIHTANGEIPGIIDKTSKEIRVASGLKKFLVPTLILMAIVIIGALLWHLRPQKNVLVAADIITSIAVLPIENRTGKPDLEYLCDGVSRDLSYRLAQLGKLKVISSSTFQRTDEDIQDASKIAARVNTQAVLYGRLTQVGDDFRIDIEAKNGADNSTIWGSSYLSSHTSIHEVDAHLTNEIIGNLGIGLTGDEQQLVSKRYTDNLEAWEYFQLGRTNTFDVTSGSLGIAENYFKKAIEKDPNYARGYAGLSVAYALLGASNTVAPQEIWPLVKQSALKSLELDDNIAEAHYALGFASFAFDRDWQRAESEFKRALEINPSDGLAHYSFSHFLLGMGRCEDALKHIELAIERNPFSSTFKFQKAWILAEIGNYDEALAIANMVVINDPEFPWGHWVLSVIHYSQGNYEEAINPMKNAIRNLGEDIKDETGMLGFVYGKTGRLEEARKQLDKLDEFVFQELYVSPLSYAYIYIGLGDYDQAFEWLEKGFRERAAFLFRLRVEHIFSEIRSDPRFTALMKKMNLD